MTRSRGRVHRRDGAETRSCDSWLWAEHPDVPPAAAAHPEDRPHHRLTECELFKFWKTGGGTELVKDVVIPLIIRLKEEQS